MKSIKFFGILLFAILLQSCNGKNNKNAASRSMGSSTIVIGTEGTYAPFTFHDAKGDLAGFDIDIMNEIARRENLKIEYKETQWDALFSALNEKRVDAIINQVSPSEERRKVYDFSISYAFSNPVVVSRKDETRVQRIEDVQGLKTAQTITSNWNKMAKKHGAEIVTVDGFAQSAELIKQKRADITFNDKLSVLDYFNKTKDNVLKIALDIKDEKSEVAVTFRKGDKKLLEKVNAALEKMKADGTLKKISEKWFGENITE